MLDQRNGRFHVVPFHVAGIVQEFPSAPKDSFMVTNLAYLESVTHAGGANVVFAKVSGYPPDVAHRVAAATSTLGTKVENVTAQTARTGSSITTVDLTGISHLEQAFAIVLAAAAMALFVALGISDRRQEFATMAAIGAPLSRISAFLWTEAAIVLAVGLALAIGLGWLLSFVYAATADGTWPRLKACREHTCEWAFYDHTKNRSGAWCSMAVCGNRAKARTYRARRASV